MQSISVGMRSAPEMSSSVPTELEEDEEGATRANLQRQAQVRKMVDDGIKRSQGIPTGPSTAPPDLTRK